MRIRALLTCCLGLLWAEDSARGEDPPSESPAPPEIYQVRAAREEAHPGSTLQVIDVRERADEQTSVPELLAELPGLQVRSLGGLGSPASASVRGSNPSQVTVYFDGVPLTRGGLGIVDLSTFSPETLERIDVWAGLPPPDRMGAGFGGVIDLVPRRASGGEARVSGGSFGTRGALLHLGGERERWFASANAAYLGTEGNFTYLDDNGTLFDPTDDADVERRNNGVDQAEATLLVERDGAKSNGTDDIRARLLQDVFYKTQGVPGVLTSTTSAAELQTLRTVSHLRVGRPGLLEGGLYFTYQRDHYQDPLNEIGNGANDQLSGSHTIGGELRATWVAGPSALVVVPQAQYERYRQDERLSTNDAGDLQARRLTTGGAIFDDLALIGGALLLEPSLRVDGIQDESAGDPKRRLLLSPRAGVRVQIQRELAVHASGGRYHRVPTLYELYGDRGVVVGNPDLEAEIGIATDVGASWRPRPWMSLGTVAHAAVVSDLIFFVQNSQQVLRAENLGRARLIGAEITAGVGPWKRLRGTASYAFLSAANRVDIGKQLPGRARHDLYGRGDAGAYRIGPLLLSAFSDVALTAGMFFDAANLRPQPRRVFVGAGLKLQPRPFQALTLSAEAKNLLDARSETIDVLPGYSARVAMQDYLGYALPGRAFYGSARLTF